MVKFESLIFFVDNYKIIILLGNATKEFKQPTVPSSDGNELKPPEVILRRTQSFESDEKLVFYFIFIGMALYKYASFYHSKNILRILSLFFTFLFLFFLNACNIVKVIFF